MDEALNTIDRRRLFMRLPEKERDAALWNMLVDEISERVKLNAEIVLMKRDIENIQRELNGISHRKSDTLNLNTEQKIQKALKEQSSITEFYLKTFLVPSLQFIHTATIMAIIGGLIWAITRGQFSP